MAVSLAAACRKCCQVREQIFALSQWATNPPSPLSNITQKGSFQTHVIGGETEAPHRQSWTFLSPSSPVSSQLGSPGPPYS